MPKKGKSAVNVDFPKNVDSPTNLLESSDKIVLLFLLIHQSKENLSKIEKAVKKKFIISFINIVFLFPSLFAFFAQSPMYLIHFRKVESTNKEMPSYPRLFR